MLDNNVVFRINICIDCLMEKMEYGVDVKQLTVTVTVTGGGVAV